MGALGVWALWQGQRKRRPVSSLWLWRGLQADAQGTRRRVIDPLWLLVLLAGILAGLTLAGPRWVSPVPQPLAVEWSVRTAPSAGAAPEITEAWVRCEQAQGPGQLLINDAPRSLAVAELHQGLALPAVPDGAGRVRLELQTTAGRAAETFENAADLPAFGLLEATSAAEPMDPALRRVFAVQRGARAGDPSVHPRVLLMSAPEVAPEDLAQADLVVALPSAALPGLTPGTTRSAPPDSGAGWTPQPADGGSMAWPSFVKLQDVHATAVRQVQFAGGWEVAASVDAGGQRVPWILARRSQSADGRPVLWLWLASAPATQTDWPNSPGFVLFFAEMQHRALGMLPAAVTDFVGTKDPVPASAPDIDLDRYLGVAGLAFLIAAMAWVLLRVR